MLTLKMPFQFSENLWNRFLYVFRRIKVVTRDVISMLVASRVRVNVENNCSHEHLLEVQLRDGLT